MEEFILGFILALVLVFLTVIFLKAAGIWKDTGITAAAARREDIARTLWDNGVSVFQQLNSHQRFSDKLEIDVGIHCLTDKLTGCKLEGHARAIFKLKDGDGQSAFLVDLIKDESLNVDAPPDSTSITSLINGSFSCGCTEAVTNVPYSQYIKHLYDHQDPTYYKLSPAATCCGKQYKTMERFTAHVYSSKTHLNPAFKISARVRCIYENEWDGIMATTKWHGSLRISFEDILQISEDVMMNFGIYFVLLWNCQDYASWILLNLGVQMKHLAPTVTDNLTGSGSTGHQVQSFKYWFHGARKLFRCPNPRCKSLPFMSERALKHHREICHQNVSNSIKVSEPTSKLKTRVFDEDVIRAVFCDEGGLNLSTSCARRYSLYHWKGSGWISHSSLVFQPWTTTAEGGPHPLTYFHTLELTYNSDEYGNCISTKPVSVNFLQQFVGHKYEVDVVMSINELISRIYVEFNSNFYSSYEMGAKNCVAFVEAIENKISTNAECIRDHIQEQKDSQKKEYKNTIKRIYSWLQVNLDFLATLFGWVTFFIILSHRLGCLQWDLLFLKCYFFICLVPSIYETLFFRLINVLKLTSWRTRFELMLTDSVLLLFIIAIVISSEIDHLVWTQLLRYVWNYQEYSFRIMIHYAESITAAVHGGKVPHIPGRENILSNWFAANETLVGEVSTWLILGCILPSQALPWFLILGSAHVLSEPLLNWLNHNVRLGLGSCKVLGSSLIDRWWFLPQYLAILVLVYLCGNTVPIWSPDIGLMDYLHVVGLILSIYLFSTFYDFIDQTSAHDILKRAKASQRSLKNLDGELYANFKKCLLGEISIFRQCFTLCRRLTYYLQFIIPLSIIIPIILFQNLQVSLTFVLIGQKVSQLTYSLGMLSLIQLEGVSQLVADFFEFSNNEEYLHIFLDHYGVYI